MKKNCIFVLILIVSLLIPYSCTPKYYSNYRGKVTKGYNKPPKEIKRGKPKYTGKSNKGLSEYALPGGKPVTELPTDYSCPEHSLILFADSISFYTFTGK